MVKPLSFKGDHSSKSRKRKTHDREEEKFSHESNPDSALTHKDTVADDNSWVDADVVHDIVGPVIFVLSTTVPSCLACDATGKVFASPVENIIDGNPATAEPHDVRQVWIALRVAGREHLNFKSHHGHYLGSDKFGAVSAASEAISSEESFLPVSYSDGSATFALKTAQETYVAVDGAQVEKTQIRGDSADLNPSTAIRVRMQARFKPKLKVAKEEKAKARISRKELQEVVGRALEDDEIRRLKRARRDGNYHEALLDIKVKNKHDKFA